MGERGVKKRKTENEQLVSHVEIMSEAVVESVKSMIKEKKEEDESPEGAHLNATVRRELASTKKNDLRAERGYWGDEGHNDGSEAAKGLKLLQTATPSKIVLYTSP